ncbi:acyl CoA binding protein-domain-containing protein [Aspergillus lucknowensis]|uniref:Acyl CoA binding protein-domain-containing protein n=1 Tax=Aspergillus lucknowensis TaxID=176173 RepID=A0ABR4M6W8_9EURO
MAVESFFTALAASSSAGKINADALGAAVQAVLAGDDDATVADAEQTAALKAGFEYATELVKTLVTDPANDDKLKLYAYFKRARDEQPAEPSFYQLESKYKYNAWKEISHISQQRAQALYIEKVSSLVDSIGTK